MFIFRILGEPQDSDFHHDATSPSPETYARRAKRLIEKGVLPKMRVKHDSSMFLTRLWVIDPDHLGIKFMSYANDNYVDIALLGTTCADTLLEAYNAMNALITESEAKAEVWAGCLTHLCKPHHKSTTPYLYAKEFKALVKNPVDVDMNLHDGGQAIPKPLDDVLTAIRLTEPLDDVPVELYDLVMQAIEIGYCVHMNVNGKGIVIRTDYPLLFIEYDMDICVVRSYRNIQGGGPSFHHAFKKFRTNHNKLVKLYQEGDV